MWSTMVSEVVNRDINARTVAVVSQVAFTAINPK